VGSDFDAERLVSAVAVGVGWEQKGMGHMAIQTIITFFLLIGVGPQIVHAQEWVAFDADYVSPSMIGRFYRATDGSMRQEGARPDGSKRFISIVNVARREHYFYTADDNTWAVRGVVVPPDGYTPLRADPLLSDRSPAKLQNIQRRPQDPELFIPPTNVEFVKLDKPLVLREVVYR
jgi:hypothetical protein